MRSLPKTANARASASPPRPEPNDCQVEPFQRATPLTVTPPAFENAPPAMSSPLYTVSAFTKLSAPVPSDCQVEPFQRAMQLAGCPPARLKEPPAINSLL